MGKTNKQNTKHHSGVFVITVSGKLIGQLRDDRPGVANPGQVGLFGGGVEDGESFKSAALRELTEETNIKADKASLVHFLDDVIPWGKDTQIARHFYYLVVPDEITSDLKVHEGQGWVYIKGVNDPLLVDSFRGPLGQAQEAVLQRVPSVAHLL